METQLDCLPCFLRQGLYAARLAKPEDKDLHRQVVQSWSKRLADSDLTLPPPLLVGDLYTILGKLIDNPDPFAKEKNESNIKALNLLPTLRTIISQSKDPLLAALEISIIGNYIDSGVGKDFHWQDKLQTEHRQLDMATYERFLKEISSFKKVMILGDNAGEIALDTLLVEELQKLDCQVIYVVREKPIINDATMEDACFVKLIDKCRVISS
ncbi:MAG TPA: ARMT1-like domain-containing protein, partial [Desulfohalobiaceae bacterium]|nr:ARMT1-like domain-containing protein [Desulfohalobiaceae bacterium]